MERQIRNLYDIIMSKGGRENEEDAMLTKKPFAGLSCASCEKNKAGRTIADECAIEHMKKGLTNGKIGSKWWQWIFETFELCETINLPDPLDDSVLSDEMLEAMNAAHHNNSVHAKSLPLETYL